MKSEADYTLMVRLPKLAILSAEGKELEKAELF